MKLGVREGDMPTVSTNISRGGSDGDREQVLGIVEEKSETQVCRKIQSLAKNDQNYTWEALGSRLMSRTLIYPLVGIDLS